MKRTAADQLSLLGEPPVEVWRADGTAGRRPRQARGERRSDWPAAWDENREATIARLKRAEKWTVQEAAFYERCSTDHILNLIYDGTIVAVNIERQMGRRPLYRITRDSILNLERERTEGART
jgi:hypothetical protein